MKKRLSYKHAFDFMKKNDKKGYYVLSNTDIFFDDTIKLVRKNYTTTARVKSTKIGSKNYIFIEKDGKVQYADCSNYVVKIDLWDCHSGMGDMRCFYDFKFGPTFDVKKIDEEELKQISDSYIVKNDKLILSLGIRKSTKDFPASSQNIDIIDEVIFNKADNSFITFNENPTAKMDSIQSNQKKCLIDTKYGKRKEIRKLIKT